MIIHTDASNIVNKETGKTICGVHSVVFYDDNYRFIKKVTDTSFSKNTIEAEGTSIIIAIRLAEIGSVIKTDSQSIVEGNRDESKLIRLLCKEKDITIEWIPREQNIHADLLCHKERNKIINLYIEAGLDVVYSPKNIEEVEKLNEVLKVGKEVVQPTLVKAKQKREKVAKKSPNKKVRKATPNNKKVNLPKNINISIFTPIECNTNDVENVMKTQKRNELVKLYQKIHKRVFTKVENNEFLDNQDLQCLEVLDFLAKNKQQKLDVIRDVCYPLYVQRNSKVKRVPECRFVGIAKKHLKYVVGTKKSLNALVNAVQHEIVNK